MRPIVDFRQLPVPAPWRPLLGGLQRVLNPFLHLEELNRVHGEFLRQRRNSGSNFFDTGLATLGVRYRFVGEDLERIPEKGPVLLLANHPFGGVDGLILGSLLRRRRPDSRLLVNFLLGRIEGMEEESFFVDPFGGETAPQRNLRGLRQSLRWLREGHALATFPSGTVSHLQPRKRAVTDPVWAANLAQLIRRSGATVVPLYFPGRNSHLFQIAGLLHERMRTALLPRELLRLRGQELEVRVGSPISAKRLQRFEDDRELMGFLRLRTYVLRNREQPVAVKGVPALRTKRSGRPVAPAQDPAALASELAQLPPENLLLQQSPFTVYVARAGQVPRCLLEIGRLREITFRAVGEGTGESQDLDRFDRSYHHLLLWHHEERRIVGAYRLGLTDEILPEEGKSGLYSTTLFRFKAGVLRSLSPAIELGRSFVVADYQRRPASLSLLWQGIGHFIARHPRYCTLFGPVSISREYQSLSKNMMVTYLKEHSLDRKLAPMVRAKNPPRSRFFGSLDRGSFQSSVRDIEDVSALIGEIEHGVKGVPVLLRQYLKLNATVLSFNVDPDFNDCLDGLVLVDLRRTLVRTLEKYMGRDGARRFLAFHRDQEARREAALVREFKQ
ncbi:MAG: GNAT family N-acetyltransferase [Verrucomicrobia bacterium]|nr:GNAT family N-acetyltransferase [Verrucomicrobiota bacterium]